MSTLVTLQRQGVSDTINGRLELSDNRYLYMQFGFHHGMKQHFCSLDYYTPRPHGRHDRDDHAYFTGHSLDVVKDKALAHIRMVYCKEAEFQSFIEAYCFPAGLDRDSVKEWADRQANDLYLTCAVYCGYSNTIRHAVTNVCLIAWENDDIRRPIFNVDGANEKYRDLAKLAHDEFLKDHNQRQGPLYAKGWLAWLLGEYIKDELHEKPVALPSVLNGVIHSWSSPREYQL